MPGAALGRLVGNHHHRLPTAVFAKEPMKRQIEYTNKIVPISEFSVREDRKGTQYFHQLREARNEEDTKRSIAS